MHTPVFLEKVLSHVHIPQDTRYIDATLGEGGHTLALARKGLQVLAIDADTTQIEAFRHKNVSEETGSRITVVEGNYAQVASIARTNRFDQCDGVLFDLGLSMRQLTEGEGFSYKHLHQPLDMIIDTVAKQGGATRAADVVASYSYEELKTMFEKFGERIHADRIAGAIVGSRSKKRIETVGDLVQVVGKVALQHDMPAIFQAIRIEVNREFEKLSQGLQGAWEVVRPGGTIQVITFHSGEDRLVKLWARKLALPEVAKYVGRAVSQDRFERSAVLRVYERTL
jgi:16S rRNA (cytosine1402-N4)-methyltransferase